MLVAQTTRVYGADNFHHTPAAGRPWGTPGAGLGTEP